MNYYFFPLFLTIITEFLVNALLLRQNIGKVLFYTFLINLLTWPVAKIILDMGMNFYLLETLIIIIESILIMLLFEARITKAMFVSLIGNGITALMSFVV